MRKKTMLILFIVMGITIPFVWSNGFKYTETDSIQKTLELPTGTMKKSVKIDNIFGDISVTGYAGNEVELSAVRTISGQTRDDIETALSEVMLDIFVKDGALNIIVSGPFRNKNGNVNWNSDKIGYIVQYDFDVKVPFSVYLSLKTVNNGDIHVKDIDGDFSVRNVNGKITLHEMAGSGNARTVNGAVKVTFKQNPAENCDFKTINGNLELVFPEEPSANFRVKTFNGDIFSDFDVTSIPTAQGTSERKKGKFVYKSNRFQGIRIGSGGPEIKMDTLNGNIIIASGK